MTRLSPWAVALASVAALGLAGCSAPVDDTSSGGSSASGASGGSSASGSAGASTAACSKDALKTLSPGKFTIGTDDPAYEPWFSGNDPANGKGYESAVAYAIADQLGYAKSDVTWVKVPFNSVVSPGQKSFDIDLNQISITDERRKAVDFSSGYYDVRQAVVTTKGSSIAGKTTVAELKGAKLGAQVGTTSYTAINNQIKPTSQANVFDTNDLAVQALKNGQIDGVVVDLPTAFYMTAAQLDNGVIVGQLPDAGGASEQFGAVLDKDSSLTSCVTKAVDALRSNGTLDKLVTEWLSQQGAPDLK